MGCECCFWGRTVNAQNEKGHYNLRVVRAGGVWIGDKSVTLSPNQSASADFWGQPLLDRQGQVLIVPRYYHAPWFNAQFFVTCKDF